MTDPAVEELKESRDRIRQLLERELAQVQSLEQAEAIVSRLERLAAGQTEEEVGLKAAASTTPAATKVEQAAVVAPSPREEVAATLATTAAETVSLTPEAEAVLEAAQDVLSPEAGVKRAEPAWERRGRTWLKEAVLHRMGPLQAFDARLYMAVNGFPHPDWLDGLANGVTLVTTGGWIWMGAVLCAKRLGVPRARETLHVMLPCVAGATWIVEHPVKTYFRRRRPFIDIVRALVVGKKPGSWSFPSGHTAASFAGAWMLSTTWKKQSPLFFALASGVGFSRVYVGAHYPGDVLAGAALGTALCEALRRIVKRVYD